MVKEQVNNKNNTENLVKYINDNRNSRKHEK